MIFTVCHELYHSIYKKTNNLSVHLICGHEDEYFDYLLSSKKKMNFEPIENNKCNKSKQNRQTRKKLSEAYHHQVP